MLRRNLIASLVAFLFVATAQAQPNIELSANNIGFDPTLVGGQSNISLTIRNIGDESLDVSDVQVNGDAFASNFGEAFSVGSGAQASLSVSFAPSVVANYEGSLTVYSNDPDSPELTVALHGDGCEPDIAVSPDHLDFGVLGAGETRELVVTISNQGTSDLTVTDTWIDGLYYSDYSDLFVVAPGQSSDITVLFNPDRYGEFGGTFNISSDDPDEDLVQLPLIGVVNGDVSFKGGISTTGDAVRSDVAGNLLFMAELGAGIEIIDISDPASPVTIGAFDTDGTAYDVAVSGAHAYIADGVGLRVLDVSDPYNPISVGFYDSPGTAYGVTVAGDYAYLADGTSGLQIVNISNPASPSRINGYNTPGDAREVVVQGNNAYVADKSRGLQIINVSNPASPTRTGFYDTPGDAYDVAVFGSYAYVADGSQGLSVISIANPAAPTRIGSALQGGTSYGIAYSTSRVFISTDGIGLKVYDVISPNTPTEIANFATLALGGRDIVLQSDYAYVADAVGGLRILDVSIVLAQPEIAVWMPVVDFGTLEVGQSVSHDLTISNSGDIDLNISSISLSGIYFTSDFTSPVSIAPASEMTFTVTYAPEAVGNHGSTLTILSDDRDESTIEFELSGVGEQNHAPEVISPISDLTLSEDPGLTVIADLDEVFNDADGDLLDYSFSGAPAALHVTLDESNVLSINPDANYHLAGGAVITVTATDIQNASQSDQFNLVIASVNDAPVVIQEIEDVTVNEDSGLNIAAFLGESFGDVDGDPLTYSFTGATAQMRMETRLFLGERVLFFESDLNYNLPDGLDITVTASDGNGGEVSDVFHVVIVPVNDPPVVAHAIGDVTVNEDSGSRNVVDLDAVFSDVDDAQLVYEFNGADQLGIAINGDHVLSITPSADYNIAGGTAILVTARDAYHATVSDEFIVHVLPVNDAPRLIDQIADVTIQEDAGLVTIAHLNNIFVDVEGELISYELVGAPVNLNIAVVNGNELVIHPAHNYNLVAGAEVTIIGRDPNDASISDVFNIVVEPVNDPPLAENPIEDLTVSEDHGTVVIGDLDDVFTDPEGNMMTYELGSVPADLHASIDGNNVLSFSPTANNNIPAGQAIEVIATDAWGLSGSDSFVITITPVNDSPVVIQSIDDLTIAEDAGVVVIADLDDVFEDIDDDNLGFRISGNPEELGMNIDQLHRLTIQSDANYNLAGGVTVSLFASDGTEPEASTSFNVVIEPVNDAPIIIAAIDDVNVGEDAGQVTIADLDNVFSDVDHDNLSFELSNALDELNMVVDENHVLSFNADLNFNIPDGITITVSASDGLVTIEENFDVTITPSNDRPVVSAVIDNLTVNEDCGLVTVADLHSVFQDPDGDILDYGVTGNPDGLNLQIHGNGVVTFNPTENYNLAVGTEIVFSATDLGGLSVDEGFVLIISPINDAPTAVNPLTNVIIDEDQTRSVVADLGHVFSDIDGDNLDFTFSGGVEALHLELSPEGLLSAAPDANYNNAEGVVISISVEDPSGQIASNGFRLIIAPINDMPVIIASIPDVSIDEDSAPVQIGDLDDIFSDPDGDALHFTLSEAPAELGLYIDGAHVLNIEPEADLNIPVGFNLTITATDPQGLSVADQIVITIHPINDAPELAHQISDLHLDEDAGLTAIAALDNNFSDLDGDNLTYTFSGAPDEFHMEITGEDILVINPAANYNHPDVIEITVAANDGNTTVEDVFEVTIAPVNDAPETIGLIDDLTIEEESGLTVIADLDDLFEDLDGDHLTYAFTGDPIELGMQLNEENVLSINPSANFNLQHGIGIGITASDGELWTNMLFSIFVNPVNDPPVVAQPVGDITVDEDPGLTVVADLDEVFSDPDGDNLNYSFGGYPTELNLELVNGNILQFDPDQNFNEALGIEVIIIASDAFVSAVDTVVITINPVNDEPVVAHPIANVTIDEDASATLIADLDNVFSDMDGESLIYSLGTTPAQLNLQIGLDHKLSVHPAANFNLSAGTLVTVYAEDGSSAVATEQFTLTVDPINDAPTFVTYPTEPLDYNENQLVEFNLSATDIENDQLVFTLTQIGLAKGAILTDHGDGTAAFSWQTGYSDAGNFQFVVTLSDGTTEVEQTVSVTVNQVNVPPNWENVPDQVTQNEGSLIDITVIGYDFDNDPVTISLNPVGVPVNSHFADNGNGTAQFTWQTGISDEGDYELHFVISDGLAELPASTLVHILHSNVVPEWTQYPGTISVNEAEQVEFTLEATDFDSDNLSITMDSPYASGNIQFTENGDGSADFIWLTNYADAGAYSAHFTLSDGSAEVGLEVAINIANVNRAPEFAGVVVPEAVEGSPVEFTLNATDPDGNVLTLTAVQIPEGAALNEATFAWTPDYMQSGSYELIFSVSDDGSPVLTDELVLNLVVHNTNRSPSLDYIENQTIVENNELAFAVSGSDPDNETLTFSCQNLPAGANFSGQHFTWTPNFEQAGNYEVNFVVSDGELQDEQTMTITVENLNRPPVLSFIDDQVVNEGGSLSFSISTFDPDGDFVQSVALGLPAGAQYENNQFSWTPSFEQAGVYAVTFIIFDGQLSDSQSTSITVHNVNRAPELQLISNYEIVEGRQLAFDVVGVDPDDDELVFTCSELPNGATFVDQQFSWIPEYNQSGVYNLTFTVTDGDLTDNQQVTIVVDNTNRAPELSDIDDAQVVENQNLTFQISAIDPDGDDVIITAENIPAGANLSGATFSWTPEYDQSGQYVVTFIASDGSLTDQQSVVITVGNTNRAPVLEYIDNQTVAEGASLTIDLLATDPDGQTLSYNMTNVPDGATLINGVFNWTPNFDMAGSYQVTFTVSDGDLEDSQEITIAVTNVNRPPVLTEVGSKDVVEGQLLSFGLTAFDPDANELTYSTSELPDGATFDNAVFNWTPAFEQSGEFTVTFMVTDNGTPAMSDEETVYIFVGNTNRAPVLGAIGQKVVDENTELSFVLEATDPDGNAITFAADGMPEGAVLSGANFNWTPNFEQTGVYEVTFRAIDNGDPVLSDEEIVVVTVVNINRPPVLAAMGSKTIEENEAFSLELLAEDPDGDVLTYTATDLPVGAVLDGNVFEWQPTFEQTGSYAVTFTVSDGSLSDFEIVTLIVTNVNRPPVMTSIDDVEIAEAEELTFTLSASDPDNDAVTFAPENLPLGASLIGAEFIWIPGYDQSGQYEITFIASDGSLTVEETVLITVTNVNRSPILSQIGDKVVEEGLELTIDLIADDPDGDEPVFAAINLPEGSTLDGSQFLWQPTFEQAGEYQLILIVNDMGTPNLSDSETVNITVQNVNRAPELVNPISDLEFNEDCGYQLIVDLNDVFIDPDGDEISFNVEGNENLNLNLTDQSILSIDPELNHFGESDVTIVASDGQGEAMMAIRFNPNLAAATNALKGRSVRSLAANSFASRDEETTDGFIISILPLNDAPDWTQVPAEHVELVNGVESVIDIEAIDVDNDQIELSFDGVGVPEAASFIDNGNGTGRLTWTPLLRDVGLYDVTFTASDGTDEVVVAIVLEVTGNLHHFNSFRRSDEGRVITITSVQLADEPIATGWEIGVFNPTGILCGATVWFDDGESHDLTAWGSVDEDRQFETGDIMNFKAWDDAARIEYVAVSEVTTGSTVWSAGENTVLSLALLNLRQQELDFATGWNLISLNVMPDHSYWVNNQGPDIRRMTNHLRVDPENPNSAHHIILMKNTRGQFYTPQFNYNSIPFWSSSEGYLVKVDANVSASWSGTPIAPNSGIALQSGWNIVAYYPTHDLTCSRNSFEVISSIIDHVVIAKDGFGRFAVPEINYSNMGSWREGRGYFINVDSDIEMSYPLPDRGLSAIPESRNRNVNGPWVEPVTTDANMSVLVDKFIGLDVRDGDLVGAFNTDNVLVGLGKVENDQAGLAVWGDDQTTESIDGMKAGETIELRYWSSVTGEQTTLQIASLEEGKGLIYESNAFTALTAQSVKVIPDNFYLGGNYPNPFNAVTSLTFGLPEASTVAIRVFDVAGREVMTLVAGSFEAGNHSISWNADGLNSGVYLVKIEAGKFESTRKVTLLK